MSRDQLIKLTTTIALISIMLLLIWVFSFVSIMVFGFKVFRENLSQTFYMSIFGILALLCGALIVNIIFNLSKIGDALGKDLPDSGIHYLSRRKVLLFLLCFPAVFAFLFLGDYASSAKKKNYLLKSAEYVVIENPGDLLSLSAYSFDRKYALNAARILTELQRQDKHFPHISVIVQDNTGDKSLFLEFASYCSWKDGDRNRADFIYPSSNEEREYLSAVFASKRNNHLFSAADGRYELYYPVKTDRGLIVLYFSQSSKYGKIGA